MRSRVKAKGKGLPSSQQAVFCGKNAKTLAYVQKLLYLCSGKGVGKLRDNETNHQSMDADAGI